MKKEEKQRELSRVLPLIWNSYQHMYDIRVNRANNSINILLIILSIISAISISLFIFSKNTIFLLILLLQFIAMTILFKVFFIKLPVHWFEYKETLKNIENKEFDKDLFVILKTLEDETHIYQEETTKIMENSFYFIFLSIFAISFILIRIYFNYPILNLLFTFCLILLTLILFNYYKKLPKSKPEEDYKKFKEDFEKWLK